MGNDLISGDGGHDTLIGGRGKSTLSGGSGTALIVGGSGKDLIVGGRGNDTLEADERQWPSIAFGLANRRGAWPSRNASTVTGTDGLPGRSEPHITCHLCSA
jgi:hypothetical protein